MCLPQHRLHDGGDPRRAWEWGQGLHRESDAWPDGGDNHVQRRVILSPSSGHLNGQGRNWRRRRGRKGGDWREADLLASLETWNVDRIKVCGPKMLD